MLLEGDRVHRVYLDQLGDIAQLPLGVALMVLTTVDEDAAPAAARMLLSRTEQETSTPAISRGIIDLIGTIMVYKFTNLSRQEIDAMLGITLQETRVYQEAKEEGKDEERDKIALNLLRKNIPLEMIAEATGLTLEQLQKLRASDPTAL